MKLFGWLDSLFDDADSTTNSPLGACPSMSPMDDHAINPANGLPMIGGIAGIDIEGNPYGTDWSHDTSYDGFSHFDSTSGFDSDW